MDNIQEQIVQITNTIGQGGIVDYYVRKRPAISSATLSNYSQIVIDEDGAVEGDVITFSSKPAVYNSYKAEMVLADDAEYLHCNDVADMLRRIANQAKIYSTLSGEDLEHYKKQYFQHRRANAILLHIALHVANNLSPTENTLGELFDRDMFHALLTQYWDIASDDKKYSDWEDGAIGYEEYNPDNYVEPNDP